MFRKGKNYVLTKVDDLLCMFEDQQSESEFMRALQSKFELSTYEDLEWHLGVAIKRTEGGSWFKQSAAVNDLLTRYNMSEAKTRSTPTDASWLKQATQSEKVFTNTTPYRSLVGSLSYLANMSRPDIAFATHQLSKFITNPSQAHWTAAKNLLRYLKLNADEGLFFKAGVEKMQLIGYSDADFANDEARKSTSGCIFLLNGTAIMWKTQLQRIITMSTCEAELVAAAQAAKEARWLQRILAEFKFSLPITIYCDNKSLAP